MAGKFTEQRLGREPVLRARPQPLDVLAVGIDQQERDADREKNQRVVTLELCVKDVVPQEHRDRQRQRGAYRPEGDVAPGRENDYENAHGDEQFDGREARQDPTGRGNALPSPEPAEGGPDMAQDCRTAGNDCDDGKISGGVSFETGSART